MDFRITDEQHLICDTIKELAIKKLNDNVYEDDEKAVFPVNKWKYCCQSNLPGLPVSEDLGGLGKSFLTTALAIKTLSRYCEDEGLIFSLCAHLCTCIAPVYLFGTAEQKKKYIPKLLNGEWRMDWRKWNF